MHRLIKPKTLLLIVFLSVLIPVTLVLLSFVIQFVVLYWKNAIMSSKSVGRVTNFQECEAAGFPILEIYPRQCRTPQGQSFTEEIGEITVSTPTTFFGQQTCLPHRDTSGPVTLECAIGLESTTGEFYALDLSEVSPSVVATYSGQQLRIQGELKDLSQNQNEWQKYDIKGIIKVQQLQLVE